MKTSYYTSAQAAAALGLSRNRVRQIARARNVGAKWARDWRFTAADLPRLRPGPVGWPKGRPRKKSGA